MQTEATENYVAHFDRTEFPENPYREILFFNREIERYRYRCNDFKLVFAHDDSVVPVSTRLDLLSVDVIVGEIGRFRGNNCSHLEDGVNPTEYRGDIDGECEFIETSTCNYARSRTRTRVRAIGTGPGMEFSES